jgi:hypothetical protein
MAVIVAFWLVMAGPVDAVTSVSISPSSQSIAAGGTAHWTGSWAGSPPFSGYFIYGDGSSRLNFNTSAFSKTFSHPYPFLCTTTVYGQTLWVSDINGGRGASSSVTVQGSHGC